ncbi:MAG: DNA adenine methylase [Bacteroidetes bacterium]|nr:DNA adenine methylase [Bacteroidota bacterium]
MMFYSPLRYPGGKAKLAEFVKSIFDKNELIGGCYVEPYAGGASVALSLLFNNYASKIIINDFDKSIFAFWHSVINETDELCKMITDTKVSMTTWKQQKQIQKQKEEAPLLLLGFSTFFLNRTNRSGIINAGVIGGNEQKGNYKIDARFNKTELVKRIQQIGKLENRIMLYNLDAIKLIKKISKRLPEKTLIYFDPPYYLKGKELYVNHYKHDDHLLVSKMINGIAEHKWLVSYDNEKEIRNLYKNNKKFVYSLHYSAVNATTGTEVMISHSDLIIPRAARPILNL